MNNLQKSLQIKMYFFIVEIKIVNPDDQNIKPLQKKLPGIYTTEKLSNDNINDQFNNFIVHIPCFFKYKYFIMYI